jgi:hypothetical protein
MLIDNINKSENLNAAHMKRNNLCNWIFIFILIFIFGSACGPNIHKTVSPIDNSEQLTMDSKYHSLERQERGHSGSRYVMKVQWIRSTKIGAPLEAAFRLSERSLVLPSFEDTLFISASGHLMKISMTQYQSSVETRRNDERTIDYKHHQGRILLSPQQQTYIKHAKQVFLMLKRDYFTINFKLSYLELEQLRTLLLYENIYPYK